MRTLEDKSLIAMIALAPLPGSPLYKNNNQEIIDQALEDLEHYKTAGVDSILIENSHDLPFIKPPLPEEAITLTKEVTQTIRNNFTGPIGIQMLEAANEQALEIAVDTDLDFLRVESYVFAHVGGAGIIEGCAGPLLRKRAALNAEHIKIYADIKKKHCSHALTADLTIADIAKQSEFFLADGFVVTGKETGSAPETEDFKSVQSVTELPILLGSGMNTDNLSEFFPLANDFIVGSTFRENGDYMKRIDPERLNSFMDAFTSIKEHHK